MGRIYQEFLRKKKPAGMNYGASTILTLGLKFMPDKKHHGRQVQSKSYVNIFSYMILQVLTSLKAYQLQASTLGHAFLA